MFSKTLNDHVRVQNQLEKTEMEVMNERLLLEQEEHVMQNMLDKKL